MDTGRLRMLPRPEGRGRERRGSHLLVFFPFHASLFLVDPPEFAFRCFPNAACTGPRSLAPFCSLPEQLRVDETGLHERPELHRQPGLDIGVWGTPAPRTHPP